MLMCLTLSVIAQDYELYKCRSSAVRTLNEAGIWSEWNYNDVDFIIRMCTSEMKVEFNNKANTVFYYSSQISTKSGIDKDGDKYTTIRWKGYDEDGLRCNFVSIDFPTLKNRNFILEYQDAEFFFETIMLNMVIPTNNNPIL